MGSVSGAPEVALEGWELWGEEVSGALSVLGQPAAVEIDEEQR